jgi:TonB family protein
MLIVAAIVLAVAGGNVFGQATSLTNNPELAPAIKLIRDGESKKAVNLLKKAVKKNKSDGVAWHYLGVAYLQVGDLKKGSDAFKKAIELQPDIAPDSHAAYAYALLLRNRLDEAQLWANQSLQSDPNNIEALYTLGTIDLRRGARAEAIEKANTLIASKPDFAAAYLLKSQAYVSFGSAVYSKSMSKEERQLRYRSAAEALEKYLQFETDARTAEPWKDQLDTLKFHLGESGANVYVGGPVTTRVRLLAKPEPTYTERARQEQIVGTVVLRCVFASDGTIKYILVMQALQGGLTEKAIAAAKKIRFMPATLNGQPVSMWMQLEYNFNLY